MGADPYANRMHEEIYNMVIEDNVASTLITEADLESRPEETSQKFNREVL